MVKIVAERVPPGDRWVLTNEVIGHKAEIEIVLTSLTDCLNEIFKTTGDRVFTVDAGKGNVSVEEERSRAPRVWDLYGEKSDDKELLSG